MLVCRRPQLGQGKQRLARSLGPERALAIACSLLDCALEDASGWPGTLVIAPDSRADRAWAAGLLARSAIVEPQPAGNLGERLNALDAAVRELGHQRLLFIGSDAPSLGVPDLLAAAAALEREDVVLIPARDGGVTLMGARRAWPDLAGLPWSEPGLGEALARCCRAAGSSVTRLTASYDVDEVADLATALGALAGDPRPARQRLQRLLEQTSLTA